MEGPEDAACVPNERKDWESLVLRLQETLVRNEAVQHSVDRRLSQLEATRSVEPNSWFQSCAQVEASHQDPENTVIAIMKSKLAEMEAKSQETLRAITANVAQLQKDITHLRAIQRDAGIDQGCLPSTKGAAITGVELVEPATIGAVERGDAELAEMSSPPEVVHVDRPGGELEEAVDEEVEEFTLEPSAWEAVIFIGLEPIKIRGTVMLFIALIANICIQVFLCVIIERSFPSDQVGLEDLEQWRHAIGHHVSHVDAFGHSLVSKVCGHHNTLSVASGQEEILESSRAYTKDNFDGPALCIVVIMLHYMFWMKESMRTQTFMTELWHLPVSATTRISPSNDAMLSLESLSLTRKLFMYFVCLARLAVATMLLWRGTLWLVYTISITDLVLNAVALEFIFDIDELLFDICATKSASRMLERTRTKASHAFGKGTLFRDTSTCLRVFSLTVFTVVMSLIFVYPNALNLGDIIESMCGGRKNFALARHEALGVFLYASTYPDKADISMKDNPIWKAVDEIKAGGIVSSAIKVPDLALMSVLLSKDAAEVGDAVMGDCTDSHPSVSVHQYLWEFLQQEFNLSVNSSCEDVSEACGSPSFHMVRMICPETCRCWRAKPSVAIPTGCPLSACMHSVKSAKHDWSGSSCKDGSNESLATNMYWKSYWNSLSAFKSLEGSADFGEVVDYAMKFGCLVISEYQLYEELCQHAPDRHSLATFCPKACKCWSKNHWGCNEKCWRGW